MMEVVVTTGAIRRVQSASVSAYFGFGQQCRAWFTWKNLKALCIVGYIDLHRGTDVLVEWQRL